MIAKLERTHSYAQQNKDKIEPPQPMDPTETPQPPHQTTNLQQQNHRIRTDNSLSQRGLKCILLVQNFTLDSLVVKTQNCLARMEAS